MLRTLSLFIFLAALLPLPAFSQSMVAQPATAPDADDNPLRIERIDATRWRVTVENREPRILPGTELQPGSRVLIPGYFSHVLAGHPVLPVRTLQFGLPAGGALEFRITALREERLPVSLEAHGDAASDEVLPFVEALPVVERSGLRIGGLRLLPAGYDAARGELRWLRSLSIEITINGSGGGIAVEDPAVLGGLLNSNDARQWAAPTSLARRGAPAFRAGEQFLKIRTDRVGMHRISPADLTAAGLSPAALDPRSFRLTLVGEEQSIEVTGENDGSFDAGDEILFFAPRNGGERGDWYDEWMEDNVLFLHWGGDTGLRRGDEDVDPAAHPGATSLAQLPLMLHLEEDHEYHRGDFEYTDMQFSRRVDGEAWVWEYLLKKDSIETRFDLVSPAAATAEVRIRVRGSSRDSSLLRATLNGYTLGEHVVPSYGQSDIVFSVPAGLLLATGNALSILSVGKKPCPPEDPICSIERFYVDWAELRYASTLTSGATGILLDNRSALQDAALPPRYLATVAFAGPALEGINLSSGTMLTGIERSGGNARMALDSSGVYYLYDPSVISTPALLELVTLSGLSGTDLQADYLMVTHRNFRAQAERLAEYRRNLDGFSVILADVEEVYNEFNHGHKDPVAIQRFVGHAMEQWRQPPPRFLVLVGDASWDPKFQKESSSRNDFVPGFGNPVSDNYFVNLTGDENDSWPSLAVGRIPAETPDAADAVIDKIIAYESAPPQPWDNRYLLSVGGENPFEQDVHLKPFMDQITRNWLTPNCLEPRLIIKKTLDIVSYDDLDTLIHEVNRGVSWFLFAGHGGTRVIDVGVERPDIFDNEDKYMFFGTMSCNTSHFAEPFETGLNERFILSPRNGAIATLGTSGLGEIGIDGIVTTGMFRSFIDSGVSTYGEMLLQGKQHLLFTLGNEINVIHAVNQLSLLGDPATRIPLARTAELAVRTEDIRTNPEIITEQNRTEILTNFRNYGRCVPDSFDVLLTISANGTTVHSERRRMAPFAVEHDIVWEYDFAGVDGAVDIAVEVDAGFEITEKVETNNRAVLAVNVLPRGVAQIFPLDRAVVSRGQGELRFLVANPSFVPDADQQPMLEVEYSADPFFALPMGTQLSAEPGMVYTALSAVLPTTDDVYYWRTRMVTSAGPERWSATRSFTLTTEGSSDERWLQTDRGQVESMYSYDSGLQMDPHGGLLLGWRWLPLEVISGGYNGPIKQATLRVDTTLFLPSQRGNSRGFNCAVIEPVFGTIVDSLTFDTYSGREIAAQMSDFLRQVPDDHVLMVGVEDDANGYPPSSIDGTNISSELRDELKRFGATVIDSVGFRDSYVLIGSRTDAASAVDDHFILGTALARDTLEVRATVGSFATPVIGPANSLQSLSWEGDAGSARSAVDLRIRALRGDVDTLLAEYRDVAPGQSIDISTLTLPSAFLRVEGTLRDPGGEQSPVLRGLRLDYVSQFPELGVTSQVVESDADSLLEGEELTVTAAVYNAGRAGAENLRVLLSVPGSSIRVEQPLPVLAADRTTPAEIEFTLPTTGLRGAQSYELSIDATGEGVEYYRANNVYSDGFIVGGDGAAPELDVLFDGVTIVDNDYVAPRPLIQIALRDASPLPVTDTSAVQLFLDGRRVWLMSDPRVQFATGDGEEKVSIDFTPELTDGLHFIAVSGKDASGNAADTIPYQVRFYVSSEAGVDEVYPYPSPTTGPMDFTFRVTGAEAPREAQVKIYTVAGRLIREMDIDPSQLRIGFNRAEWDGRDQDGDALANGVYFYKLIVRQGEESTEYVGRFAVLR